MTRLFAILAVCLVVLLAMGFAAVNAGHRATLDLGLFTLYQVPVTLVAFSGLFVGMLVMFATGIHTDLKVRRILRDRLAQEAEREQTWTDRNQRDLFADPADDGTGLAEEEDGPEQVQAGPMEIQTGPAEIGAHPTEEETGPAEEVSGPEENRFQPD